MDGSFTALLGQEARGVNAEGESSSFGVGGTPRARPRVVVVGGGFGGLRVVDGLRGAPVDVVLIDRCNFHFFQPLSYQVATGALSPGEVAYPLRALFKTSENVSVLLAEVVDFDLDRRVVLFADKDDQPTRPIGYDTLIVATGSRYSYFGNDEWASVAPDVKSLQSALNVRSRILAAFERAELTQDGAVREAELTFVVVGGGPTGVEMAGQIAELAKDTLRENFRSIDPGTARVLLIDTGKRVLSGFPESLSAHATDALHALGITTLTRHTVVAIEPTGVTVEGPAGERERIPARTVIWAAGVTASPLAGRLAELDGTDVDSAGRVAVTGNLTLPGHPEAIVLGDMAAIYDIDGAATPLPGVAPVAIQQGRYAAKLVRSRLLGRDAPPFRYRGKGNVATIGRACAVADIGPLRLSGVSAWFVWLGVHLWYLIGLQNRLLVLIRWSVSFLTHGRGARLIDVTGTQVSSSTSASRAAAQVT